MLADVLTAEQAKRFRQVMLQSREQAGQPGGFGLPAVASAAAYPGVAAEVKLTDEQKKRLLDGQAPAEVLTADQKAAVKLTAEQTARIGAAARELGDVAGLVGRAGRRTARALSGKMARSDEPRPRGSGEGEPLPRGRGSLIHATPQPKAL